MSAGAESSPSSVGVDAAALDRAVRLIEAREAAAQLAVLRDGQVVLDTVTAEADRSRPERGPRAALAAD